MEEPKTVYSGKIPVPTKEEIADHTLYETRLKTPEFSDLPDTISALLNDSTTFDSVVNTPEFKEMVAAMSADPAKEEPSDKKDGEKASEKEGAVPAKKEEKLASAVEPSALAVEVPAIMEVGDFSAEAPAVEVAPKSTPLHDASFRDEKLSISTPIKLDTVAGLHMLSSTGLESCFKEHFPANKTFGKLFNSILNSFSVPGRFGEMPNNSGVVDPSIHAYVPDSVVSPFGYASHEYTLSERLYQSENVSPASLRLLAQIALGLAPMTTLTDVPVAYGMENRTIDPAGFDMGNNTVLDLATKPRPIGTAVKVQEVLVSPELIRRGMRSVRLYNLLYQTYDPWLAENINRQIIDPNIDRYIRHDHSASHEVVSANVMDQSVYRVLAIGANGADTDNFFYNIHLFEPLDMCAFTHDRSFAIAEQHVMNIASGGMRVVAAPHHPATKGYLSKLENITPEAGAQFSKSLVAGLTGGHRRVFLIDAPPPSLNDGMIRSLAAFANLLLMDIKLMDEQTLVDQLCAICDPVCNEETEMQNVGMAGAPNAGVVLPNVVLGYKDAVSAFMVRRGNNPANAFFAMPQLTKFISTKQNGGPIRNAVRLTLEQHINAALRRAYNVKPVTNQVFSVFGKTVMFPFLPRGDAFEMVRLGIGAAGAPPMYELAQHNAESQLISTLLQGVAQALGQFSSAQGFGDAVQAMFSSTLHLKQSMAIVTSAVVHASYDRDTLPMTGQWQGPIGAAYSRVVGYITVPFLSGLSFCLSGVVSADVEMNDKMVFYRDRIDPKFPSTYPILVGLYRMILNDVYYAVRVNNGMYMDTHPQEFIELVKQCVLQSMTSVTPDFEKVMDVLIEQKQTFPNSMIGFPTIPQGAVAPLVLPAAFKDNAAMRIMPAGQVQVEGEPLGAIVTAIVGNVAARVPAPLPAPTESAMNELIYANAREVTEFYITKNPIVPSIIDDARGASVFVYSYDPAFPLNTTIMISDLMAYRFVPSGVKRSIEDLKNLAEAYAMERMGGVWECIKVDKIITSFNLVEDKKTEYELRSANTAIEVVRRKEYKDGDKFEVPVLEVPVHRMGDRMGRNIDIVEESKRMSALTTNVLVPLKTIMRSLVHFDGVDVDGTNLFSHSARGRTTPPQGLHFTNEARLARFRIRTGHGHTVMGKIRVTHRQDEKLTETSELVKRLYPGT